MKRVLVAVSLAAMSSTAFAQIAAPDVGEGAQIRGAFCEPDPCSERTYGGCQNTRCELLEMNLELAATDAERADAKEKLAEAECSPAQCELAWNSAERFVQQWRRARQEAANCATPPANPAALLLPTEEKEADLAARLARIRCGAKLNSRAARALAFSRNQERCAALRQSSRKDCDGNESNACGAAPADLARWTAPTRNLCVTSSREDTVSVHACAITLVNAGKSPTAPIGTVCPAANLLEEAVAKGQCVDLTGPLPSSSAKARRAKFVTLGVVLQTAAASQLPLLPGAHEPTTKLQSWVSVPSHWAWQTTSATISDIPDSVDVLYFSEQTKRYFVEKHRMRDGARDSTADLAEGWKDADLEPPTADCCSTDEEHAALGEFSTLIYAYLIQDPSARPLTPRQHVKLADGGSLLRQCLQLKRGPICIEHEIQQSSMLASTPRTRVWRPTLERPLIGNGQNPGRSWELLGDYLAARAIRVAPSQRVVIAGHETRADGERALLMASGESPVIARSSGKQPFEPGGPIVSLYLDPLHSVTGNAVADAVGKLASTLSLVFAESDGVLATDPFLARNGKGRCFLRQQGAFCGMNDGALELMTVARPKGESDLGLGIFSETYQDLLKMGPAGSPKWSLTSNILSALLAAKVPARSVRAIDQTANQESALWLSDLKRADGSCAGKFGVVPVREDSRAVMGSLLTLPGAGDCEAEIYAALRLVLSYDQVKRMADAAAALIKGGATEIEIYVGPKSDWKGSPYLEIALLGLRPAIGAAPGEITLGLAHPGLPPERLKNIESVTSAAHYKLTLDNGPGRLAFMNCFLNRDCPGPRFGVNPFGFF